MSDEQIDTTPLGRLSAELMEGISELELDEGSRIREVAVIAEIDHGDSTSTLVHCTDDRTWVKVAFLREVAYRIEDGTERAYLRRLEDEGEE